MRMLGHDVVSDFDLFDSMLTGTAMGMQGEDTRLNQSMKTHAQIKAGAGFPSLVQTQDDQLWIVDERDE